MLHYAPYECNVMSWNERYVNVKARPLHWLLFALNKPTAGSRTVSRAPVTLSFFAQLRRVVIMSIKPHAAKCTWIEWAFAVTTSAGSPLVPRPPAVGRPCCSSSPTCCYWSKLERSRPCGRLSEGENMLYVGRRRRPPHDKPHDDGGVLARTA